MGYIITFRIVPVGMRQFNFSFFCVSIFLTIFLIACNFGSQPAESDQCAEMLNLNPASIITRINGSPSMFGGLGDSIFWRVDTNGYVWYDGQINSIPQQWDGGIQIPGVPYFWHVGFALSQIYFWDGTKTKILDHPLADLVEFKFSGNRLVWNENQPSVRTLWYFNGSTLRQLNTASQSGISPRISPHRVAWLGANGVGNPIYILENDVVRELLPGDVERSDLVLTDDIVTWIESGSVWVYQDGVIKTIDAPTDMNTNLFAYGKRIAWSLSYIAPNTLIYYDGEKVHNLKDYPNGTIIPFIEMNAKGMLIRVWVDQTVSTEWYDGGGFRIVGNTGSDQVYLSETHAYGFIEYQSAFNPKNACTTPVGSTSYILRVKP